HRRWRRRDGRAGARLRHPRPGIRPGRWWRIRRRDRERRPWRAWKWRGRSEEHTSELQSLAYLVCRLLLETKKTSESFTPPTLHYACSLLDFPADINNRKRKKS